MLTAPRKLAVVVWCAAGLLALWPVGTSGQEKYPDSDTPKTISPDKKKGPELPKGGDLPKDIQWKLKLLSQDPLKVVRTGYDDKQKLAYWVMELTRDLDGVEDAVYWGPANRNFRRPFVSFELHNADGIVMRTLDATYIGEYVTQKGKRFGVVLEIPEFFSKNLKSVEAVSK